MRFGLVSAGFGRIEKIKWPKILEYLLFSLGVFSVFGIVYNAAYKTENSEIRIDALLRQQPSKKASQDAHSLSELFYPKGDSEVSAEQGRFRVHGKLAGDDLLMAAPVAKLTLKVVGLLCDKDNHAGMVIIEVSGRQQSYVSGEAINDTYPIIKIFSDRIVINENGFYAALMLES
ncbi:type II secretion system protein N [Serratia quinivorans]|uniref:type II secretion system protein N n=1 Tax=Serratia quinivorans TaxID=137545 RepID=UPI00217B2E05|nr:type II secretion system protein N [Serratia quinivorans]CAI1070670.1 type II secretion system protein C [Serratia quinivorans]